MVSACLRLFVHCAKSVSHPNATPLSCLLQLELIKSFVAKVAQENIVKSNAEVLVLRHPGTGKKSIVNSYPAGVFVCPFVCSTPPTRCNLTPSSVFPSQLRRHFAGREATYCGWRSKLAFVCFCIFDARSSHLTPTHIFRAAFMPPSRKSVYTFALRLLLNTRLTPHTTPHLSLFRGSSAASRGR